MSIKDIGSIVKDKEKINHILLLRKEKKYDEIYKLYGKTIYKLSTPSSYKKKDLKKLFKEGKYEDVLYKYGKDTYKSNIHRAIMRDTYIETGSRFKALFASAKYYISHKIAPIFLSTALLLPTTSAVTLSVISKDSIDKNSIEYAEDLEKYGSLIEDYANDVKSQNLSDIQIIAKVVSDMWNDIEGYGAPKRDIYGFSRLDMLEENPCLVCRNMADHVTAVLNEINPSYNARNIPVYLSSDGTYNIANIDRTIIDNDDTVKENKDENNNSESIGNDLLDTLTKFTGNHMVTAIDLNKDGITLIIDPTNPSLGVYKNGKIHMFSQKDGPGFYPKEFMNFIFYGQDFTDFISDYVSTFKESSLSLEELEEKYGIDAFNTALEEIESKDKKIASSTFDERYKVDTNSLSSSIEENNNSQIKDTDNIR